MASFKLEKGGKPKDQANAVGAILVIIGIAAYFPFGPYVGGAVGALGLVLLIGSFAAKE